jgi:beta-1,4-N-acetylglucosaminyltransferase
MECILPVRIDSNGSRTTPAGGNGFNRFWCSHSSRFDYACNWASSGIFRKLVAHIYTVDFRQDNVSNFDFVLHTASRIAESVSKRAILWSALGVSLKRVLVTVGTTPFDSLIREAFQQLCLPEYELTLQVSNDSKLPTSMPNSYSFVRNITSLYAHADLVVTHAGAGSVFRLLELGKRIVVVPNTERRDKHQFDIAKWVYINELAAVCYSVSEIGEVVEKSLQKNFFRYKRDPFHGIELLRGALLGRPSNYDGQADIPPIRVDN